MLAIIETALRWIDRVLCGWRGHEMVRSFEPARLSLRCLRCGAETPGWSLGIDSTGRRPLPHRGPVLVFRRAVLNSRAHTTHPSHADAA